MRVVKILAILLVVYIAVVAAFESLLGYFQPQNERTVVITTVDDEGEEHERVVSRLEVDGSLYVAVNHWPRAWYGRVLEHPRVQVTMDGDSGAYVASEVHGEEYERVDSAHSLGWRFRLLTGFPPRRILRLDPE
jgi:hypothetical protein